MIEHLDEFTDEIVQPETRAESALSAKAAGFRSRRGGGVLLATARRSLANWFKVALATAGLSLTVSPDGLHALMSAVRESPDLVILDDDLPGVDAERVEEMLARDGRTAGARILHVKPPPDDTVVCDAFAPVQSRETRLLS